MLPPRIFSKGCLSVCLACLVELVDRLVWPIGERYSVRIVIINLDIKIIRMEMIYIFTMAKFVNPRWSIRSISVKGNNITTVTVKFRTHCAYIYFKINYFFYECWWYIFINYMQKQLFVNNKTITKFVIFLLHSSCDQQFLMPFPFLVICSQHL